MNTILKETNQVDEPNELDGPETYERFLRRQKYAERTVLEYLRYAKQIEGKDASQELINKFVEKNNNVVARAFLKSFLNDYFETFEFRIPKIKGRSTSHEPVYVRYDEYIKLINDPDLRFELKVLFRVLFETGLRISEAIHIDPDKIDFIHREIRGIGKGNKKYCVYIKPKTAEHLKHLLNDFLYEPGTSIWGFDVRRANQLIVRETKRILGKPFTAHSFRHGTATHLLKIGWNLREVQQFMRHEGLDTMGVYTHIVDEDMVEKRKLLGY